jgi:kinetochore protein NDC80
MASDAQIEKMEKELARMRAGLTESVQLMEQREMNTNLEYEQLTVASSALREELHTELERMLNDIIKFKVHIQSSLEGYEEFVAQEVERECEEQEREEMGVDDEKYGEDLETKVEEMDLDE